MTVSYRYVNVLSIFIPNTIITRVINLATCTSSNSVRPTISSSQQFDIFRYCLIFVEAKSAGQWKFFFSATLYTVVTPKVSHVYDINSPHHYSNRLPMTKTSRFFLSWPSSYYSFLQCLPPWPSLVVPPPTYRPKVLLPSRRSWQCDISSEEDLRHFAWQIHPLATCFPPGACIRNALQ